MKLPEEFKQKWIEALRSGAYLQGKGRLYDELDNTYCCLGVACIVAGIPKDDIVGEPTTDIESGIEEGKLPKGLVYENGDGENDKEIDYLMQMNDQDGKTFEDIADFVEKNH